MIRLDSVNRKLQVVLAGAITTNQLPVLVSYSDKTSTTYNGASQLTNTNSTTAVDVCASPATSTIRDVDLVSIRNSDTASATVTVRYNDNATLYTLLTITLAVGDHLVYTHGTGWQVLSSAGGHRTLPSSLPASEVSNTPAGTLSATNVQTALNELDTEKAPLASPALTGTVTTAGSIVPTTNGTTDIGDGTKGLKRVYIDYTNTATVGAVTINKAAGRVNIAAAGTSVVVTNSLVTAASHVVAWASQADATARVLHVVPAAGSFTITTAATTAQTAFDFFVINAD